MAGMKLVILDRDGVLNAASDDFITVAEAWVPLPGALEAVARINQAGYHVVIASDQSGLGRGLFDVGALNAIHARLHKMLAAAGGRLDAVFYCPHGPDEPCACRKPLPGLFEQISERFGVNLSEVPTVGANIHHLVAGVAAGCEPHLLHATPDGEPWLADLPAGTQVHADLAAFAEMLLARPSGPSVVSQAFPLPLAR